ncbi:MAG: hypothetical protein ACFCUQ_21100 [Kiloniellales bacterium]
MGGGEYAVMDGQAWRWQRLTEGGAMHLHAMAACRGELVVITGGWEGQLQIWRDGGTIWHLAATYPKGEASFSRLVAVAPFAVAPFKERCFVGASAAGRHGGKLLEWTDGRLVADPSWPEADRAEGLTVHDGLLFAWSDSGQTRRLLAFDGTYLWAVSGGSGSGTLWRSRDGSAWTELQRFAETPISVRAVAGAVFVGTHHKDGGTLWGPLIGLPPLGATATAFEDGTRTRRQRPA